MRTDLVESGGPGPASAPDAASLQASSVGGLLVDRAAATPTSVLGHDERLGAVTFGEHLDRCSRVAAGLSELGVEPGCPVAWMLPTNHAALLVMGALSMLGAVQVPVVPIVRQRELGFILRQTGARHLIISGEPGTDYATIAAGAVAQLDHPVTILVADDGLPEGDPASSSPPEPADPDPDSDPVRWIFYTSGTTADPKGVLHTDATLLAAARNLNDCLAMVPEDRYGMVFPITHIGGVTMYLGGLLTGYSQVLLERFELRRSVPFLSRVGATIIGGGPVFWDALVTAQRASSVPLFPALRALAGGGAPKSATIGTEVREVFDVKLVSGYGMTECPGLANNRFDDAEAVLARDGHAGVGVEIRVARPDGTPALVDEQGELLVRGPMLCRGYLDATLDDGAFDDEGFFRSGDLATMDEHGSIVVTGRIKDVIIRKGENISALEVELLLRELDAVADVAVVGLPDAERGERCCACVVLAPGAELDLDTVVDAFVARGVARQKIPEQLEVFDELPYRETGKLSKPVLLRQLGDRSAASPTPTTPTPTGPSAPTGTTRGRASVFEPTPKLLIPELSPRAQVALLARALWQEGHQDHISGHISFKQPDDTLIVNPYHLRWDEVRASHCARIDLDGNVLEGEWFVSTAIQLHLELHRARPDIVVAVHNHTDWGNVWAGARRVPPVYDQTSALVDNDVVLYDAFGTTVHDPDEAQAVVTALGDAKAAILAHHGVLVVASDIARAYTRCMSLEWRCREAWHVEVLGSSTPMPAAASQRLADGIERRGYPGLFEAMARREIQRDPEVLDA